MTSDGSGNAGTDRPRRWSTPELWTLGAFSAIGLIGFIATFVLIVYRSPDAQVPRALTDVEMRGFTGPRGPPGERGPVGAAGPAGPRGAAGDTGVRMHRVDCSTGTCTAECNDDEVLLTAYCSPSRAPAAYPNEHTALCRTQGVRAKVEVVAACVKVSRR
jgi:hypothetical protein